MSAIKLICNLLTDEQSRGSVLTGDGLFGIFHGALSDNKGALKFSLACLLNLTFLTNKNSSSKYLSLISKEINDQIAAAGGLAHLLGAI